MPGSSHGLCAEKMGRSSNTLHFPLPGPMPSGVPPWWVGLDQLCTLMKGQAPPLGRPPSLSPLVWTATLLPRMRRRCQPLLLHQPLGSQVPSRRRNLDIDHEDRAFKGFASHLKVSPPASVCPALSLVNLDPSRV